MPSERDKRASRAASEALTGNRKRTVERLVDEATGTSPAPPANRPPAAPVRTRPGTSARAARASERREGGVRTFGPPLGRMREGQSTDSNN